MIKKIEIVGESKKSTLVLEQDTFSLIDGATQNDVLCKVKKYQSLKGKIRPRVLFQLIEEFERQNKKIEPGVFHEIEKHWTAEYENITFIVYKEKDKPKGKIQFKIISNFLSGLPETEYIFILKEVKKSLLLLLPFHVR